MSYSVLRRYTPPTCTLEIMAKSSPLSRWTNQPVLKHLRFQLNLDDPKVSQEHWITLKGDRVQLETLCDVVTTYVQQFLQSQNRMGTVDAPQGNSAIAVLPARSQVAVALQTPPTVGEIALQPKGLLAHELSLGSLATEETGPTVRLSALQLFDLANALDEYAADVVALPTLQPSAWSTSTPGWRQIAVIALVMIGLSASLVKLLEPSQKSTESTVATSSQGASSSDQRIATQLPPTVADNAKPALSSGEKLPPPPPVGSMVPVSPGLPTVSLPQTAPTTPPAPTAPADTQIAVQPAAKPAPSSRIASIPPSEATNRQAKAPAQSTDQLADAAGTSSAAQTTQLAPAAPAATGEASREANDRAEPGTAFDTVPQVAEARRYFEQRWSPPQGLSQTLEYTLAVNPDGTVQGITPLGQAAGDYVDRTGIPLVGEPFVSANKDGRSAKIRVVLSPDGSVQTFLE